MGSDVDRSDWDVNGLDELDDDAFKSVILWRLDTAPPANKVIWRMLCDPLLVERTLGCLEELADELTQDVGGRGLPSTHGKVKRVNMVRKRIDMVNAAVIRGGGPVRNVEGDLLAVKRLLQRLALAVDAHRLVCVELDLAPEPHDLVLWDMLDELRLVANARQGAGPSLAEQIAAGHWRHDVG